MTWPTAVAEFLGNGSEARFAEMMTAKARELGMNRTIFKNASGLPDSGQVSTAADMARLSISLRRNFPHYYGYFGQTEVTVAGRTIKGHNKAMEMIPGADGLKDRLHSRLGLQPRHLGHKRRQIRGRRGDGRGLCRHSQCAHGAVDVALCEAGAISLERAPFGHAASSHHGPSQDTPTGGSSSIWTVPILSGLVS